jgi:hypothetical protein
MEQSLLYFESRISIRKKPIDTVLHSVLELHHFDATRGEKWCGSGSSSYSLAQICQLNNQCTIGKEAPDKIAAKWGRFQRLWLRNISSTVLYTVIFIVS